ncbi:MAG: nucleoside triphosphate pyrophosphohydrolase [Proteobacteria bacterium]|nr:nucleoside triphosphate pyrophosphohydrolase [Pseudomonadota bacterium]
MSAAAERLEALLQLMRRLRDPQQGCPWDRAQDFATIAPHTIEEAYELEDAIAGGERARIRDELGDLLFQVVFHAQLAAERGWFDFADVAAGIHDKLVRRHPHVFGDAVGGEAGDLAHAWDAAKASERAAAGASGALAGVARALPALARAAKLARRAGVVGFDWFDERAVRPKIAEELRETEQAVGAGDAAAIEEELGDVLFAVANWARLLKVDPENALRAANRKFERRFAAMEALIAARGWTAAELDAARWDELWVSVKATE